MSVMAGETQQGAQQAVRKLTFLDFPAEVRNKIYEDYFHDMEERSRGIFRYRRHNYDVGEEEDEDEESEKGPIRPKDSIQVHHLLVQLAHTNRKIRFESLSFFFSDFNLYESSKPMGQAMQQRIFVPQMRRWLACLDLLCMDHPTIWKETQDAASDAMSLFKAIESLKALKHLGLESLICPFTSCIEGGVADDGPPRPPSEPDDPDSEEEALLMMDDMYDEELGWEEDFGPVEEDEEDDEQEGSEEDGGDQYQEGGAMTATPGGGHVAMKIEMAPQTSAIVGTRINEESGTPPTVHIRPQEHEDRGLVQPNGPANRPEFTVAEAAKLLFRSTPMQHLLRLRGLQSFEIEWDHGAHQYKCGCDDGRRCEVAGGRDYCETSHGGHCAHEMLHEEALNRFEAVVRKHVKQARPSDRK